MLTTKPRQRAPDMAPAFTRLTDLRRVIMLTLYATPAQRTEIVYAMGWLYERMERPTPTGMAPEDWYAGVVKQLLADMERVALMRDVV